MLRFTTATVTGVTVISVDVPESAERTNLQSLALWFVALIGNSYTDEQGPGRSKQWAEVIGNVACMRNVNVLPCWRRISLIGDPDASYNTFTVLHRSWGSLSIFGLFQLFKIFTNNKSWVMIYSLLTLEIPSSFDQNKHRGHFDPLISLPISPKRLVFSMFARYS